jgi:hypothetical protein
LLELHCGQVSCIDPLLPLRYLQWLNILACRSTTAQLARLSSLTQLTHISIQYGSDDGYGMDPAEVNVVADFSSPAWPALASQLRELHIFGQDASQFRLSGHALAALGSLSVMTSLKLECLCWPDVLPQQLAAALQRCTALRVLQLHALSLQWAPGAEW